MTTLRLSRATPTTEGAYWTRKHPGFPREVVQVFAGREIPLYYVRRLNDGGDVLVSVIADPRREWAGPIDLPLEPDAPETETREERNREPGVVVSPCLVGVESCGCIGAAMVLTKNTYRDIGVFVDDCRVTHMEIEYRTSGVTVGGKCPHGEDERRRTGR